MRFCSNQRYRCMGFTATENSLYCGTCYEISRHARKHFNRTWKEAGKVEDHPDYEAELMEAEAVALGQKLNIDHREANWAAARGVQLQRCSNRWSRRQPCNNREQSRSNPYCEVCNGRMKKAEDQVKDRFRSQYPDKDLDDPIIKSLLRPLIVEARLGALQSKISTGSSFDPDAPVDPRPPKKHVKQEDQLQLSNEDKRMILSWSRDPV